MPGEVKMHMPAFISIGSRHGVKSLGKSENRENEGSTELSHAVKS